MANSFGRRKVLGIREQLARMRGELPRFHSRIVGGALVAVGDIQPTSQSIIYKVRIEYRADERPEVSVVSPSLAPREKEGRIKHAYPGNKLCLYTPCNREWTPDMSLALTIVPWIAEWLFYYELWHITGEWLGGGTEPAVTEPIRNNRETRREGE